jgi:hypothetical protein
MFKILGSICGVNTGKIRWCIFCHGRHVAKTGVVAMRQMRIAAATAVQFN